MVVTRIAETCLLAIRQTIFRWHDLCFGSQTERGKLNADDSLLKQMLPRGSAGQTKRTAQVHKHKANSINAVFSGGLSRSSNETLVMRAERRA